MKKQTRLLLIGGGALAVLYLMGAFGTSTTGSMAGMPQPARIRRRRPPNQLSGLGIMLPGMPALATQTLPGRAINPSHRARYQYNRG